MDRASRRPDACVRSRAMLTPALKRVKKCVSYRVTRNREAVLRIRFRDDDARRAFNAYDQLEKRYGAHLATRIATRLAVLAAARDLGRVPRKPPIRLRALDGGHGRFAVDLAPPHRLLFAVSGAHGDGGEVGHVDEALVDDIEVLGVE